MPVCYITISENVAELSKQQISQIRQYVAKGLDSKSRMLDETHIAIRIQHGMRENMLGDIELDIFAQFYLRRFFSRDKRANNISKDISSCLKCCCATWINMSSVGYSRVTEKGEDYFSDSNNAIIHRIQKIQGVSSTEKRD